MATLRIYGDVMDIKRFKAWAESKNLSTDGETGRNYSYTFYDSKTQAAFDAWQAAKAQAVPGSFVSRLKSTIENHYDRINDVMHEEGYDDKSFGQLMALDFVEEVISEMTEAQEQSHD